MACAIAWAMRDHAQVTSEESTEEEGSESDVPPYEPVSEFEEPNEETSFHSS
jgi:hypothetical protein